MYPAHGGGERGYESRQALWRTSEPQELGIRINLMIVATNHHLLFKFEHAFRDGVGGSR